MPKLVRSPRKDPKAPFGEADLDAERLGERDSLTVYPGRWQPGQSDIQALTVPPGEFPSQNLPGSIEEAVLAALEQVPRTAAEAGKRDAVEEEAASDSAGKPARS